LKTAVQWAQHFGAELRVLHVVPDYPPDVIDLPAAVPSSMLYAAERRETAEAELMNYLSQHLPAGNFTQAEVRLGHTAQEITRAAQEDGVDLMILSTHGHTGWRHVIFGSIAEEIVRTAPCKVLTLGPTCQSQVLPSGDTTAEDH
jgi:nucleotide-binding universal stress UspA family protein